MKQDRSLDRLTPEFRQKVEKFLSESPEIFLTETFRTEERQKELYAQGRTKPGRIVTWLDGVNKKSLHQLGIAIDIAFNDGDLYPRDYSKWRKVADTAKKYGIDWGYDLWNTDMPHFQDNGKPLLTQITMPEFDVKKTASDWGPEAERAVKWVEDNGIFSDFRTEDDLRDAIKLYRTYLTSVQEVGERLKKLWA